ncbi:MAG: hypothetical protein FRX49_02058 [Trebouxia sp. A1-2]|nr:MAG: hypothetical protein FRX49_02058 [Trebouxia sp. A1-2]
MNRESARRTRLRKQQQVTSLKEEVAALQLQNLRTNERLSASAEKNRDLSAESQRIQLHNQLLMKCMGELTAITKRKEGTIEQLRHCIQNAEKLTDIPLPPTEQVEEQLSAESLQLLYVPQVQQATGSRLTRHPGISAAMPATTYVPTPARMHDAMPTCMSSPDPALMQSHKIPSFAGNSMPSTLVSQVRSNSLNSHLWAPGVGAAKSLRTENATHLPIHLSNHMAAPSSSSQQPGAALDKLRSSLPGNHVTASGSASQYPSGPLNTLQPCLPGNRVTASGSSSQHPRGPLNTLQPSLPGNPAFGMDFGIDNTTARLYRHSAEATVHESAARKALMSEVAKLEQGFNPDHAHQLAHLSAHSSSLRTCQEGSLFGGAVGSGTGDPMQDILGTAMEWQLQGAHQQPRRVPPMPPACHSHTLQIPALDCSQQGMALCPGGFQETPMQRMNEHVGGGCNYSHY